MIAGMISILFLCILIGPIFILKAGWAVVLNLYIYTKGWYDWILPWHLRRHPETRYDEQVEDSLDEHNQTEAD